MILQLKLYDCEGIELNDGDLVKISNGHGSIFFTHVLIKDGYIHPFDNFSFHKIWKCDKLPENAKECNINIEPKHWYISDNIDFTYDDASRYLMDWRVLESRRNEKCYRIEKIDGIAMQKKLF